MLTKTIDGALTTYGYDNGWKDQLTSVNDTQLTYDANGNMLTYGDVQYEWNCAHLSKITDSENEYLYLYNENGIRESKIINGEKIRFNTVNGAVVAQSNNNLTDTMYFQYSNGVPVGFIHNDTQYLYITNLSGDVVGITDIDGNLIAEYTYDEWGKLLAITPAEEDNAEQLTIAETNPLRYRGYYYDNETGLYYLQSRYYNPELGRFISADGFEYIDTSNRLSSNAYAYCWNCPVAFSDIEGTTPELAFDMDSLIAFFRNAGKYIKEKFQENFTNLQSKFNAFVEKAKFWITHPDVIINNMLSQLLGREVHLRFRLVEWLRDAFEQAKQEQQQESPQNEDSSQINTIRKAKSNNKEEEEKPIIDNRVMAIFQGIVAAIELNWINDVLEFLGSSLNKLAEKAYEAVKQSSLLFITAMNTVYIYLINSFSIDALSTFDSWILEKGEEMAQESDLIDATGIGKGFGVFISIFSFFLNVESAGSGAFSKTEDNVMNVVKLVIDLVCLFVGPVAGVLVPLISDMVIDISALRIKGLVFMY